jgi:protein-tyrosine phosphatase
MLSPSLCKLDGAQHGEFDYMTISHYVPENFRDVGEALTLWLKDAPIPTGMLLRGGKLDAMMSHADFGHARTIINLREAVDDAIVDDADWLHLPAPHGAERYDTSQHAVRDWIRRVVAIIDDARTQRPIYVHCARGRDRTGIVVAAWLLCKGVALDIVIEEYMLSSTTSEPLDRNRVREALEGLASIWKT